MIEPSEKDCLWPIIERPVDTLPGVMGYGEHGVCPFCVCSDRVDDIYSADRFGIHKLIDVETVMNRSNIM